MEENVGEIKIRKSYRIYTAHLSTNLKPGAVLRVSKMYAGCAASAMAYRVLSRKNSIKWIKLCDKENHIWHVNDSKQTAKHYLMHQQIINNTEILW